MTSSASAASRRRCATPSPANRIAQSFVFSGPRGVGKTTTARILARGLNCDTGADRRSLRRLRRLRRDRGGPRHGRPRDRRRHPHAGRQGPRRSSSPASACAPVREPLQDLHHRRSAPALAAGVRRAAQVDRGAAAARRLHDGDDRDREGAGDDPVAVAGVRAEDDRRQADRRPAADDRRRRTASRSTTPR